MSLLQDVLRSHTLSSQLSNTTISPRKKTKSPAHSEDAFSDDDGVLVSTDETPAWSRSSTRPSSPNEDELIGVISLPGTPSRSRATSRSSSPTRGSALGRPAPGPLHLPTAPRTKPRVTDPLKAFPTEVSQRIFGVLRVSDLARCARVSKKWSRSQTLNYIWFQHYRKENFQDTSLPQGKWTKRESKQNWRVLYVQSSTSRPTTNGNTQTFGSQSGYASPSQSGYQTPREMKEEKWREEAAIAARPAKNELRDMYKELGGRKSRGKNKLGAAGSARDKGGWGGDGEEGW